MNLILKRPLVIFDLETTGIHLTRDRIIELYAIKIQPDAKEQHLHHRINPEISIPAEATAIHGITDADVQHEPTFRELSPSLFDFFRNADIGGFNSNRFDLPILIEEFNRCGYEMDLSKIQLLDAQRIFHMMEPRNLSAAYRFYCGKDLDNAHSAEADTRATWEIIKAQVQRYDELEGSVPFIHHFTGQDQIVDLANRLVYNDKGEEVFNFGKYKGRPVMEVFEREPSYYDWMMHGDFPADTKRSITRIWLRRLNSMRP